jgi:hypothetical protein
MVLLFHRPTKGRSFKHFFVKKWIAIASGDIATERRARSGAE